MCYNPGIRQPCPSRLSCSGSHCSSAPTQHASCSSTGSSSQRLRTLCSFGEQSWACKGGGGGHGHEGRQTQVCPAHFQAEQAFPRGLGSAITSPQRWEGQRGPLCDTHPLSFSPDPTCRLCSHILFLGPSFSMCKAGSTPVSLPVQGQASLARSPRPHLGQNPTWWWVPATSGPDPLTPPLGERPSGTRMGPMRHPVEHSDKCTGPSTRVLPHCGP